ncbi:hypothetical protein PHJA_001160200 [Phtheirospermum japonicum]|uniref:Uncharacterized protein n=1 Tax=Phtheirospermum japonicum TaxID=374723 RepID=A0A830C1Z0_9LAMI|nr:hypothetical protein PHJA_001160200 [Phtheirospermum japonicum]
MSQRANRHQRRPSQGVFAIPDNLTEDIAPTPPPAAQAPHPPSGEKRRRGVFICRRSRRRRRRRKCRFPIAPVNDKSLSLLVLK